jgi:DNA topoisomerase-1
VQLGETPERGSREKPRRASLTGDDDPGTITLDRALELLSLPRVVGRDPGDGREIVANIGRFGPYVKRGDEFRSLESEAQIFEVTLDEALELFRQEKPSRRSQGRTVLRELGAHPASGSSIRLLEGRFGPYVSDGTTNASLPKGTSPDQVTLESAVTLLQAREGSGNGKGGRRTGSRRGTGTSRGESGRRPAARRPRTS